MKPSLLLVGAVMAGLAGFAAMPQRAAGDAGARPAGRVAGDKVVTLERPAAALPKPMHDKAAKLPRPATLKGFSDEGSFVVYKDEEQLANIRFVWKADGSFENKCEISIA